MVDWQFLSLLAMIALGFYALATVIVDRLPPAARRAGHVTKMLAWHGLYRGVDLVGGAICWFLVWLWRGLIWGPRQSPARPASVNRFPAPVIRLAPAVSPYVPLPATLARQDAPSAPSAVRPSASSAPDRLAAPAVPPEVARLTIDRSRSALIEALIIAGWSTTQIREVLRGANDALSAEIAAARQRLGLAERRTPIAGRPVPAGVEYED